MRIIIISFITYLLIFPVLAESSYLCVGEKTAGFNVERNLNVTKFTSRKWILKKTDENSWSVFKIGKSHPEMYCDDTNADVFDKLNCYGLYGNLLMSKTTLRYVSSIYGQYIDDDRNTENIVIEIGECSKI